LAGGVRIGMGEGRRNEMYLARAKLRHTVRVTAVDVCVCYEMRQNCAGTFSVRLRGDNCVEEEVVELD